MRYLQEDKGRLVLLNVFRLVKDYVENTTNDGLKLDFSIRIELWTQTLYHINSNIEMYDLII